MPEKISMDISEKLELDYLVEQVSDNTIGITSEPNNVSTSINYIRKHAGVFDPPDTGTYKLDINGQIVKIDVTDIPDSGIARYNFDDDSDATLATDSWNNNDGSISGASYSTDSQVGTHSLLFDGTDDVVDSTGIQLDAADSFTVGGWIKTSSSPPTSNIVIQSQRDGYSTSDWAFSINNQTDIQVYVGEQNNTASFKASNQISTDVWEFVVLRKNGNDYEIYHNGNSMVASSTNSGGWTTSDSHRIGAWEGNSNVFDGRLDDQRVYGDAISGADIQTWYDNTK